MMNRYRKILLKDETLDIIGLGLSDISSFSGKKLAAEGSFRET
jgi:hypothetical protein